MTEPTDTLTIDAAISRLRARFPNSQFRIAVVEEWAPRGKKKKKSSVTIAILGHVAESAPTLVECVDLICEWGERR